MTESEIKEMLNGIINNGEKWEGKTKDYYCSEEQCDYEACGYTCKEDCNWQLYKLGDAIHDDWEYRKIGTWYVYEDSESGEVDENHRYYATNGTVNCCGYKFKGSKEECVKWIKEHTKKTFLEELNSKISPNAKSLDFKVKETATEVCKKILQEYESRCTYDSSLLKRIITNLGIDLGD